MRLHGDDDANEQADRAEDAYTAMYYGPPPWRPRRPPAAPSETPNDKEFDHDRDQH